MTQRELVLRVLSGAEQPLWTESIAYRVDRLINPSMLTLTPTASIRRAIHQLRKSGVVINRNAKNQFFIGDKW